MTDTGDASRNAESAPMALERDASLGASGSAAADLRSPQGRSTPLRGEHYRNNPYSASVTERPRTPTSSSHARGSCAGNANGDTSMAAREECGGDLQYQYSEDQTGASGCLSMSPSQVMGSQSYVPSNQNYQSYQGMQPYNSSGYNQQQQQQQPALSSLFVTFVPPSSPHLEFIPSAGASQQMMDKTSTSYNVLHGSGTSYLALSNVSGSHPIPESSQRNASHAQLQQSPQIQRGGPPLQATSFGSFQSPSSSMHSPHAVQDHPSQHHPGSSSFQGRRTSLMRHQSSGAQNMSPSNSYGSHPLSASPHGRSSYGRGTDSNNNSVGVNGGNSSAFHMSEDLGAAHANNSAAPNLDRVSVQQRGSALTHSLGSVPSTQYPQAQSPLQSGSGKANSQQKMSSGGWSPQGDNAAASGSVNHTSQNPTFNEVAMASTSSQYHQSTTVATASTSTAMGDLTVSLKQKAPRKGTDTGYSSLAGSLGLVPAVTPLTKPQGNQQESQHSSAAAAARHSSTSGVDPARKYSTTDRRSPSSSLSSPHNLGQAQEKPQYLSQPLMTEGSSNMSSPMTPQNSDRIIGMQEMQRNSQYHVDPNQQAAHQQYQQQQQPPYPYAQSPPNQMHGQQQQQQQQTTYTQVPPMKVSNFTDTPPYSAGPSPLYPPQPQYNTGPVPPMQHQQQHHHQQQMMAQQHMHQFQQPPPQQYQQQTPQYQQPPPPPPSQQQQYFQPPQQQPMHHHHHQQQQHEQQQVFQQQQHHHHHHQPPVQTYQQQQRQAPQNMQFAPQHHHHHQQQQYPQQVGNVTPLQQHQQQQYLAVRGQQMRQGEQPLPPPPQLTRFQVPSGAWPAQKPHQHQQQNNPNNNNNQRPLYDLTGPSGDARQGRSTGPSSTPNSPFHPVIVPSASQLGGSVWSKGGSPSHSHSVSMGADTSQSMSMSADYSPSSPLYRDAFLMSGSPKRGSHGVDPIRGEQPFTTPLPLDCVHTDLKSMSLPLRIRSSSVSSAASKTSSKQSKKSTGRSRRSGKNRGMPNRQAADEDPLSVSTSTNNNLLVLPPSCFVLVSFKRFRQLYACTLTPMEGARSLSPSIRSPVSRTSPQRSTSASSTSSAAKAVRATSVYVGDTVVVEGDRGDDAGVVEQIYTTLEDCPPRLVLRAMMMETAVQHQWHQQHTFQRSANNNNSSNTSNARSGVQATEDKGNNNNNNNDDTKPQESGQNGQPENGAANRSNRANSFSTNTANVPSMRTRMPRVLRVATDADLQALNVRRQREIGTLKDAQRVAKQLLIPAAVEDVAFQMDGSKLSVFIRRPESALFVDFRRVQRRLYRTYHCRIWVLYLDEVEEDEEKKLWTTDQVAAEHRRRIEAGNSLDARLAAAAGGGGGKEQRGSSDFSSNRENAEIQRQRICADDERVGIELAIEAVQREIDDETKSLKLVLLMQQRGQAAPTRSPDQQHLRDDFPSSIKRSGDVLDYAPSNLGAQSSCSDFHQEGSLSDFRATQDTQTFDPEDEEEEEPESNKTL